MIPDQVVALLESMKRDRAQLDSTIRNCYRYIDPLRGSMINNGGIADGESNLSSANSDKTRIYDGTAADCVRRLSALIISGLTPANSRWFDLDVMGEPNIRHSWLDDTADALWREIHASNYDAVAPEIFADIIIGGQTGMFIDIAQGMGLVFEQWGLAGMYFRSSRPGGAVDTVIRELEVTKAQLQTMYPDANLGQYGDKIKVIHAIYPRPDGKPGAAGNMKPIGNCVFISADKTVLEDEGYEESPLVVPRWKLIPSSAYAVGPAYDALPDIQTLNEFVRDKLLAGQLAIGGMWGAVDDGVINPKTVKIGPRRVVPMASKDSFFRLDVGADSNVAMAELEGLRQQVRMMMLAEGLVIPQDPGGTATEWNIRMDLLRQMIGPVFGRLQSEFLKPMISRVFGLMLRNGLIDPPPEEIQNASLSIRYVSPLARAQRGNEVAGMRQFEADLMQMAQVDPGVLDVYDIVAAQREKSWLLGVPQKFMRDEKTVKKMAQDRAQAQQAQQEEALSSEMALKQAGAMK